MSDLLVLLRTHDPSAQKEVRRRVFPLLLGTCSRVLRDKVAAAETAEDVWTDFLVSHVQDLRREESIVGYLRLMAVRRSLRVRKARSRFETLGGVDDADPIDANDAERVLIEGGLERERDERLVHCLGKVTPRTRHVLRMRFHHDMTLEAVGEVIGTSKQYVGKVLAKALQALRRCMESEP